MATRFYLPRNAESTPISPSPATDWENTSILARALATTTKRSLSTGVVTFSDSDVTDKDILFRQYISEELVADQLFADLQPIKAQCLCGEATMAGNLFLTLGIRILAGDGTTIRRTVLPVTRDNVELVDYGFPHANRKFNANSASGEYTTVAGDRLVIEVGTGGDPGVTGSHGSELILGDTGTDLPEDDTSTDGIAWVQLVEDLSFVSLGQPAARRFGAMGHNSRIRGSEAVRMF